MASKSSFFFSHRIWFYFQSMLFPTGTKESEAKAIKEQYKRSRVVVDRLRDVGNRRGMMYLNNFEDVSKGYDMVAAVGGDRE